MAEERVSQEMDGRGTCESGDGWQRNVWVRRWMAEERVSGDGW